MKLRLAQDSAVKAPSTPLLLTKRFQHPAFAHPANWVLCLCAGLALSLFGSERASYALSPGIRAAHITLQLEEPVPFIAQSVTRPRHHAETPPLAVQVQQAGGLTLSIPSAFEPGPAAAPFFMGRMSAEDFRRAEQCLTTAIYYEAASESEEGQRAVAQVVLNRVRHPAWPKTVCGVIYQGSDRPGCQFSYACDGSMRRRPEPRIWAQAAEFARDALSGHVYGPVGMATHYHTLQVNPVWNQGFIITAVLGNHIFYRLPGSKGSARAFTMAYAGGEPYPAPLRWRGPALDSALPLSGTQTELAALPSAPKLALADADLYVPGALPQSDILPRFRQSGSWRNR